jgi:hypothetical protein
MLKMKTLTNWIRMAALSMAVLSMATYAGLAQSTTQGGIAGTVFDSTDAVIPNAKVVIHNDGTNAELTLATDGSGYFKAPQLDPGTYSVTISAPGFSNQHTTNVTVLVSNVTDLSSHLATGSAQSQTVEVTAQVPVIKFDSPAFGGQLDNHEIESIPINNRRWSSLTLLTPGATNDNQGFGLISFRAIQPQLNNVQIDGADDNQVFYGEERGRTRAGYSTAQTAVREFQVNTGVYSAEFGRAVGGVINSVTKSGTNQLHGELYFYHRDQQWGASNNYVYNIAYNQATGSAVKIPFKAKDKRNQYGFGIGGPLIKDKLFFFYAFDQYRRVFPGTGSAVALSFYNPLTTAQGTTLARSIYLATGNSNYDINSNPTTAAPLAQAAYNNYISAANSDLGQVPRIGFQIINTPKLDWQVNSKERVSVLYHRLRWDSPGGVQTQQNVFYTKEGFGTDFVKLDYGVATLDSLITSSITNELRYQYGRELNDEGALANNQFTNQLLTNGTGISSQVNLNNFSQGFIAGQPYYAFRPKLPDERKWQIADTAIGQFGNHSVRAGVDIVHNYDIQQTLGFSGYSPNGTFNYTSILASAQDVLTRPGVLSGNSATLGQANLNAGGGGCGAAGSAVTPSSYIPISCYSYYRQTVGPQAFTAANTGGAPYDIATIDYGFFVQDDWKFSPNLTLNIGARYDYESIPDQAASLVSPLNPGSSSHISDKNNIAPRVGFAWDPYGKGQTVLRGGYGMYYGRIPNVGILGARFQSGSPNGQLSYNFSSPSLTCAASNPACASTPGAIIAPLFSQRPNQAYFNPAILPPDVQYLDPHLQNPYTEEFDLAVQQALGLNTVISITYLGALGKELPNSLNLNIDPTHGYTVNYTVVAGSTGTCGALACGSVIPVKVYGQRQVTTTGTAAANLNNNFGAVYAGLSNVNSNYHALSLDVTKRAGKWISFDANYTWSHALDYRSTAPTGFSSNNFFDPYGNGRANYGNADINVRHRATGWASFTIPGTRGIHFVDAATNGWSIKPAFQMQSGLPYSANVNGTTPVAQCAAVGCLQANNSGLSGVGVSYIPAAGRNQFFYPRDIVLDLRVQKEFKVTEKASLQFIMEAFNVANHQNITSLVTTAYNLTNGPTPATSAATPTGTLTYQPLTSTGGFGFVNSSNSNFAYSPRNIQAGARLFF